MIDRARANRRIAAVATIGLALLAHAPAVAEPGPALPDGFVVRVPDQIVWQSAGADGIEFALLYGNPSQPGLYIMRVRFPANTMSRPHTHDQDRFVTVIEGTWHAGTQASFDPAETIPLPAGSFMIHPAGAVHYDGARDAPTIVEIRGIGPVQTSYLPKP